MENIKHNFPHIVKNILDHLEMPLDRLRCRQVCKIFQIFIDKLDKKEKRMSILFGSSTIELMFDKTWITYKEMENGTMVLQERTEFDPEMETIVENFERTHFRNMGLNHIQFFLSKRDISLDSLSISNIEEDGEYSENGRQFMNQRFVPMIQNLPHPISTKSISVDEIELEVFDRLLTKIVPGVLEKIEVHEFEGDDHDDLVEKICYSPQWKQAKQRKFNGATPILVALLTHCQTFWIDTIGACGLMADFRTALFRNEEFDQGVFWLRNTNFDCMYRTLGEFSRSPNGPEWRLYTDPETGKILEFRFEQMPPILSRVEIRNPQFNSLL